MEAHAGTIGIGIGHATKPRRRRLAQIREGIRIRRLERARRTHALRASGVRASYVAGSEHTHLMSRPKGF